MSFERINIMGEEERPLGEIISHKDEDRPDEDRPEIPEGPEMPEEEPQIEEIIPEPPKKDVPPPPPPSKGILERIWKKKKRPGVDKPN